jgi:hypothetical protein
MRKKNRGARGFLLFSPVSNSAKPANPLQSLILSRLILLKAVSANLQQKGGCRAECVPVLDKQSIIYY